MRWAGAVAVSLVDKFLQQRATLGEHLIDVPVGALIGVEYGFDITRGMSL
jgi:hypothetical protein